MGDNLGGAEKEYVSGNVFAKMISNNELNGKVIKDIIINHHQHQRHHANFTLNDVTFVNVDFEYTAFTNATFSNCKFINCHFFDCHLEKNKFIDCHFENATFLIILRLLEMFLRELPVMLKDTELMSLTIIFLKIWIFQDFFLSIDLLMIQLYGEEIIL